MRYTAALRLTITNFIIKNGITPKYTSNLKRIYNAESFYLQEEPLPYDLFKFLFNLLTAIYIVKKEKGLEFVFDINIRKNCLINLKPFTYLILNLCANADRIEISNTKGNLIIKTNTIKTKYSLKIIKKLKGCIYYERKSGKMLISLPFTETDKKPVYSTCTTEEYIINPLSVVNVFMY